MPENKYCIIEKDLLDKIIMTLKTIDVRGYDSMDALVGCVTVLSNIHEEGKFGFAPVAPQAVPAKPKEKVPEEEE